MDEQLQTDAKKLKQNEQYLIRKNIIRLSSQYFGVEQIAEMLGVSTRLVYSTKKAYRERGIEGIKPRKRGRRTGEKRNLTPEQEKEIQEIIRDKTPEQLKLKCCLWNRRAIRDLIMRKYKIEIPVSTLGVYLRRWGYSVQRPIKKARKQNPELVDKWLHEEYPAIEKQAKEEKGEIYWGDETALQNTANYAKGYAPIGHTPVLLVDSVRMKLTLLSAVSNQGRLRFTISKESVGSDKLICFMRMLIKDAAKKVFLILDNLKAHHSKKVTTWVASHKGKIEIYFLPAYSPEYNPDEYLNSDMKQSIGNKPIPMSEKELESNARSFLKFDQLHPARIKSYFLTSYTIYAG